MTGITSLMNQGLGRNPVEQMSNENAIGTNTGYPMAYMNTPAYAVPRNTPQPSDVIHGGQDVNIDPYTGEEKFANGGIAGYAAGGTPDPFAASKQAYDYLMGGAQGQQGIGSGPTDSTPATSGWSVPEGWIEVDSVPMDGSEWRYVYEPGSNVRHIISKPKGTETTSGAGASTGSAGSQKTSGYHPEALPVSTGEVNMDNPLYKLLDKGAGVVKDYITGGGLLGALFRPQQQIGGYSTVSGVPYNFGEGYGISTEGEGIGSIGASQMTPQQIESQVASQGAAPTPTPETNPEGFRQYVANRMAAYSNPETPAAYTPTGGGYTGMSYGSDSGSSDGGGSSGAFSGGFGGGSSDARGGYLSDGKFDQRPSNMADGGLSSLQYNLGSYSDGGRLLKGPGDGVSDDIPAVIGDKQPARLADGEFVVPARIVSELGNGSTEAGARKLYAMMDRVQQTRSKSIGKGKVAVNSQADKHLPK
jgi:hypothetical protein